MPSINPVLRVLEINKRLSQIGKDRSFNAFMEKAGLEEEKERLTPRPTQSKTWLPPSFRRRIGE